MSTTDQTTKQMAIQLGEEYIARFPKVWEPIAEYLSTQRIVTTLDQRALGPGKTISNPWVVCAGGDASYMLEDEMKPLCGEHGYEYKGILCRPLPDQPLDASVPWMIVETLRSGSSTLRIYVASPELFTAAYTVAGLTRQQQLANKPITTSMIESFTDTFRELRQKAWDDAVITAKD